MRDRLIELLSEVNKRCAKTKDCSNCVGYEKGVYCKHYLLADHLLAEGVIAPPCKVGDKIYVLSASKTKLYLLTITHFVVCENETQIWAVGAPYTSESTYICNADDLGNNEWVYLTREEAERALERSEKCASN